MEVSGQLHAPAALTPRERAPGTHWIGGWVGPRAVLDAVVKRKILNLISSKFVNAIEGYKKDSSRRLRKVALNE
jgi:hypothetical protein